MFNAIDLIEHTTLTTLIQTFLTQASYSRSGLYHAIKKANNQGLHVKMKSNN